MRKLILRLILGVLLAAIVFVGSTASVAVADEAPAADPNTAQAAE